MSYRKSLISILSLAIAAIVFVIALYWASGKPNAALNGFKRNMIIWVPEKIHEYRSEDKILAITRLNSNAILLRNKKQGSFLVLDSQLEFNCYYPYFKEETQSLQNNYFIENDDSIFYLLAFNAPYIKEFDMKTNRYSNLPLEKVFTKEVVINPHSIVLRTVDSAATGQEFVKVNMISRNVTREKDISIKNKDGGMVTDGQLNFDKQSGCLIYVYFYGNGFICMDTDLNLKYRGRTIDTELNFKASIVKTRQVYTHNKPPKFVNKASFVADGLLYIYSGLKADNEAEYDFIGNAPIDVYQINSGRYLKTFYLPEYKHIAPKHFCMADNGVLLVAYANYIVSYRLSGLIHG